MAVTTAPITNGSTLVKENFSATKCFRRKYSPRHRISAANWIMIPICGFLRERLDMYCTLERFSQSGAASTRFSKQAVNGSFSYDRNVAIQIVEWEFHGKSRSTDPGKHAHGSQRRKRMAQIGIIIQFAALIR